MLFRILFFILIAYGVIGIVILWLTDWVKVAAQLQYMAIYVVAPWLGALAIKKHSQGGLALLFIVFAFISVRIAGWASSFPFVAPISISITFGDFTKGTGGVVDLFAIMVTILVAVAMYQINNGKINESKPTE